MTKKQRGDQSSNIDRETWRQILKAAEELFLVKGYKGVSMKDVADVVQVTAAALYYHFPQGKEDLFMSVLLGMIEEWGVGIGRAIAPAHNIRERLHLLTLYQLTLPIDHLPVLMQDAKEQMKDRKKQQAIFEQMRGAVDKRVAEIFQQAIDVCEITADIPASLLATMYQGMVIALRHDMYFSAGDSEITDIPGLASSLVSTLLDGIARPV